MKGLPPVSKIATGYWFALAQDKNGQVWGWGRGSEGQLGLDPALEKTPITLTGEHMTGTLAIAAGLHHSMTISHRGELHVFGFNGNGELGLQDTATRFHPIRHSIPVETSIPQ